MSKHKQVSPRTYDKDFFRRVYRDDNLFKNFDFAGIHEYYLEIAKLASLEKTSRVIDFGCGNGNLSFYLKTTIDCWVLGIDYSKDGIEIANKRLGYFEKSMKYVNKLSFICKNNANLPRLKGITDIFSCDVFEHMYDEELLDVLDVFKSWSGSTGIKLYVHTDNNYYLSFVRPLLDFLMVGFGKTSYDQLKLRNQEEAKVHVNLTNPNKLSKLMNRKGFRLISVSFPKVTKEKIIKQLGPLGGYGVIVNVCNIILAILRPLSPSFFAVYEYKANE